MWFLNPNKNKTKNKQNNAVSIPYSVVKKTIFFIDLVKLKKKKDL